MLMGSIRLVTLSAVFAFAAHAAGIAVDGGSCSGDPAITTEAFTIQTDSNGDFCVAFTNNLPSGNPTNPSGPPINSLDFVSGITAGAQPTDFTCFTDIFANCTVATDTNNNLLTIRFWDDVFIGNVGLPQGIPNGDTFFIGIEGFAANQSFDVDVNQPAIPEPGSIALLLAAGVCLLFRPRASRAA